MIIINNKINNNKALKIMMFSMTAAVASAVNLWGEAHGESLERASPLKYQMAATGLPQEGMWKSTPVFGDVNGDGWLDLAALVRLGNGAHVWLGDGKGQWSESSQGLAQPSSCGGGVDFGDVNGDGHLDLAVADHCHGVSIFLGNNKGHWHEAIRDLNPSIAARLAEGSGNPFKGAEDLALGDVNEDGALDLIVAASDRGGLTVYFGDGSGNVWKEAQKTGLPNGSSPRQDPEQGGWANELMVADVNKDGHLDIVASYYAGPRVWRGDGKGHWQSQSAGLPSPIIGGLFRGIDVGDVNEDGRLDVVVANAVNGPEIFLQEKNGLWRQTPDIFPDMRGGAESVALAELNGDGHLDLVVGGRLTPEQGYGLFISSGNGRGSWSILQATGLPTTGLPVTWGVAYGDVNADQSLDFAVTTGGNVSTARRANGKEAVSGLPRLQVWIRQPG
jgi:hypothetical protein